MIGANLLEKKYGETKLNTEIKTTGVILCDQIKTMDITDRNFKFLEDVPEDILENVLDIVFSLMEKS